MTRTDDKGKKIVRYPLASIMNICSTWVTPSSAMDPNAWPATRPSPWLVGTPEAMIL